MEVPSGARSLSRNRAHYALIRKVETANTDHIADAYLMAEVHAIRRKLERPGTTLKHVADYLVILLYCYTSLTSTSLGSQELDFALPHAVTLAEAGESAKDKRIGQSLYYLQLYLASMTVRISLLYGGDAS
jgi:AP-4 complex subunit epsilon-1